MITRRWVVTGGSATLAAAGAAPFWPACGTASAAARTFPVAFSERDWRKRLTPDQFEVLRHSGTERAFTSPLLNEHRAGTFACAGCEHGAFSSTTKFDSHTGWPSFWAPIEGAVDQEDDKSFGMVRSAVQCSTCGGHLGHVFDDGPKPTGLRYCMNGVAMTFKPDAA